MTGRPWFRALLWALLASGHVATVPAQSLWRCGPDGRTFSDRPCADGVPLEVGRRPPPEAVSEARAVAAREREALRRLALERRQRHAEAALAGVGPAGIGPLPAAADDRGTTSASGGEVNQAKRTSRAKRQERPSRQARHHTARARD